ncbi:MAG: response regulator [Polyangiaceae bacterium]|jgi:DNA-binding response OmpR family regulator
MSDPVPRHRPSSGTRPRGPLVLVVEDEDDVRELYAAELASAGFMVLEAPDGATAVEKALQFGPHAIVLDLTLPGIDGFKVARRLRADDRTHDVAIVALTAPSLGDGAVFESLAIAAGCDSLFSKPVPPGALIGEVVRLVARRSRNALGS